MCDSGTDLSLSALGSGGMKTTPRRLYSSTTQMREKTREPPSDPQASYPLLRHHSAPISGENEESSTQTKLHSLLNSYTKPPSICAMFKEGPPRKVRLKPPVPKFISRETPSNNIAPQCIPNSSSFSTTNVPTFPTPTNLRYTSVSAGVGPHNWRECPRRQSPRKQWRSTHRSASAPGFPVLSHRKKKWSVQGRSSMPSRHWRSATLPNRVPLEALSLKTMDLALSPRRTAPAFRPPFIVRCTDSRMLERRNFCGTHCVGAARHFSKEKRRTREEAQEDDETPVYLPRAGSTSSEEPVTTLPASVPALSEMYNQYLHGREQQPTLHGKYSSLAYTHLSSDQTHPRTHLSPLKNTSFTSTSSPTHTTPPLLPRQHHTHSQSYSSPMRWLGRNDVRGQDLVAKYLMVQPGNTRGSSEQNPSKLIEEKLRQLKEDCCEYKVHLALLFPGLPLSSF